MFKYDFQLSGGDKNIGTVYLPSSEIMTDRNLPASYIELVDGNHGLDNVADEACEYIFSWVSSRIA